MLIENSILLGRFTKPCLSSPCQLYQPVSCLFNLHYAWRQSDQPKLNVPASFSSALEKTWTAQGVWISSPLIWCTNVYLWWRTIFALVKHNWLFVCTCISLLCWNKMVLGSCMCEQGWQYHTCAGSYRSQNWSSGTGGKWWSAIDQKLTRLAR